MNNNHSNPTDIALSTVHVAVDDDDDDDDDDDSELDEPQVIPAVKEQIDPTQLQWAPWIWYYTKLSAKKGYEACDTAGEKLAWFFGITKPKYYSEIQEYERMDEEEREAWRQSFQDIEQTNQILDTIVTNPPQSSNIFTISHENVTNA